MQCLLGVLSSPSRLCKQTLQSFPEWLFVRYEAPQCEIQHYRTNQATVPPMYKNPPCQGSKARGTEQMARKASGAMINHINIYLATQSRS